MSLSIFAMIDRLIGNRKFRAKLGHLLAHGKHQSIETGTRNGGNGKEHVTVVERHALEVGDLISRTRGIAFVGYDDLRTLR